LEYKRVVFGTSERKLIARAKDESVTFADGLVVQLKAAASTTALYCRYSIRIVDFAQCSGKKVVRKSQVAPRSSPPNGIRRSTQRYVRMVRVLRHQRSPKVTLLSALCLL
jgi:hypothetical protein